MKLDLSAFKNLLLSVDSKATKFKGNGETAYTIWTPHHPEKMMSDDSEEEVVWQIQVDRFTKTDNEAVAAAIYDKLTEALIPFGYDLDYEEKTGYFHHIYSCFYKA